jgi:hypothetical protein
MLQYLVEIGNANGADLNSGQNPAVLFPDYIEAVQHLSELLCAGRCNLGEPVEIHIVPVEDGTAQDDEDWTMEEILRNAG